MTERAPDLNIAAAFALAEELGLISGASAKKSGRPLAQHTIGIRDAILDLTTEYDVMTVRQAFYALVTRGVVPKDETRGYRPVQRQLLLMRKENLLPWTFIADETRWRRTPTMYDSLGDAIAQTARLYRRNPWTGSGVRVELWLEKDALAGVVVGVTEKYGIDLMVSRGVSSATFLHSAIREAVRADEHGVGTLILTLFDYDAGGARAHRMIADYFAEYAANLNYSIRQLALTRAQIEAHELPTRPAKRSDPESTKWGDDAVELDALPPDVLCGIAEDALDQLVDPDRLALLEDIEASEREYLAMLGRKVSS